MNLDLVEHLSEAVAIIDRGRLVVEGRVDELASTGPPRLAVGLAEVPAEMRVSPA